MRFAVKRAKGLSEAERRNFLAELQTWIDLPEHRESRSLVGSSARSGNEVLIFAEYVEAAASELDRLAEIYQGGKEKTLERMLDIGHPICMGPPLCTRIGACASGCKAG